MRNGIVIVLVIASVAAGYLLLRPTAEVQDEAQPAPAAVAPAPPPPAPAASAPRAPAAAAPAVQAGERRAMIPPADERPSVAGVAPGASVFRIDTSGQLVIDEQTRLDVEALFASTDRRDLPQMKQQHTQNLPPAAAAQALDLLDRYENYEQAQRQAYPPGVEPVSEESALAELDGLHNLRVSYFGETLARALYGAEEQLSRSLLQLMELEKDPSMTMEEKAMRAQQLRDTLPEFREQQQ